MKYILLLILTFPIFAQSIENSKSASTDNTDNSTKTIEPDKNDSQTNIETKDNTNLTQAEMRKKRKLEIGIGYGEGNDELSETPGFLNLNLEYNLTSRFSFGYSQLNKQKFSTSPFINPFVNSFDITEKTNSLEVGLFNFRYYLFEKFPLYFTGGLGRDFVSRYKRIEYHYGFINQDFSFQSSPLALETDILPANYRFLGFGFQWVFQNGFFIGTEMLNLQSRYTYKGNSLILDKNYSIIDGIIVEKFINPTYKENLNSNVMNIRLGYSLQF